MGIDLTAVHERKYMRSGVISSIPYFAEGPGGYGDCPTLEALGVSRYMCRASGVGDSIVRTYAGLVPLTDPRASAHRRWVEGVGELAYMKGSYAIYEVVYDLNGSGLHGDPKRIRLEKRMQGHEAYNLHVYIKGTGGRGKVSVLPKGATGSYPWVTLQVLDFDANIDVHEEHEWWLLLDTYEKVSVSWNTEFLGKTDLFYLEYPGDTPV